MNNKEKIIEEIFKKIAETNVTLQQRLYVTWYRLSEITGEDECMREIKETILKLNLHEKYKTINELFFGALERKA